MTDKDLSFIGTDELFAEISKRYDGALLVWCLDHGGDPHIQEIDFLYKSWPMAVGLTEWAKNALFTREAADNE